MLGPLQGIIFHYSGGVINLFRAHRKGWYSRVNFLARIVQFLIKNRSAADCALVWLLWLFLCSTSCLLPLAFLAIVLSIPYHCPYHSLPFPYQVLTMCYMCRSDNKM